MYDLSFIFDECGFVDVPEYVERERLFNVSFDTATGDIKLYVLDRNEQCVHKLSRKGTTRQYAGDAPEFDRMPDQISRFLGKKINFEEIIIDAVEDDVCYLYLDDASLYQKMLLVDSLCDKYSVAPVRFLETINAINNVRFDSIENAMGGNALSLIKVPLMGLNPKLYGRPFLFNYPFVLNDKTSQFLVRLYGCRTDQLMSKIEHMWVARELLSSRSIVVTQHHALLHRN